MIKKIRKDVKNNIKTLKNKLDKLINKLKIKKYLESIVNIFKN